MVSKARGTQAFRCSGQLSVENNNNRWIQSGQLVLERPAAGEQMMKCESAVGGAGDEEGVALPLRWTHTSTHNRCEGPQGQLNTYALAATCAVRLQRRSRWCLGPSLVKLGASEATWYIWLLCCSAINSNLCIPSTFSNVGSLDCLLLWQYIALGIKINFLIFLCLGFSLIQISMYPRWPVVMFSHLMSCNMPNAHRQAHATAQWWDRPHWLWFQSWIAHIMHRLTGGVKRGAATLKQNQSSVRLVKGGRCLQILVQKICPSFSQEKRSFRFINSTRKRNYLPTDPNHPQKDNRTKSSFFFSH